MVCTRVYHPGATVTAIEKIHDAWPISRSAWCDSKQGQSCRSHLTLSLAQEESVFIGSQVVSLSCAASSIKTTSAPLYEESRLVRDRERELPRNGYPNNSSTDNKEVNSLIWRQEGIFAPECTCHACPGLHAVARRWKISLHAARPRVRKTEQRGQDRLQGLYECVFSTWFNYFCVYQARYKLQERTVV